MKILVTGATGFVGKALVKLLVKSGHQVFALSRNQSKTFSEEEGVHWIFGDLLLPDSLPDLEEFDKAFYLVHGLKGTDKDFEYEESVAAVNFVNWIRPTGAGIIYLGALGPSNEVLSSHLRSRQLTGAILGASGLSTIEFRASIILGEESLSFEMIKAMAERFPLLPDMGLLNHPCQPLSLKDLLHYLLESLNLKVDGHEIIEIGGPEVTTYGELLKLYSELSGHKKKKLTLPDIDMRVLQKLLDVAIPEYALVGKKLTESLTHATVVTNNLSKESFPDIHPIHLREAMERAMKASQTKYLPIWEKEFIKMLVTEKVLLPSGALLGELLKRK